MSEKIWHLKSCQLFERLTDEQVSQLESRAQVRTFGRGELVYLPSDPGTTVLLVASGRIKLYHITSDGKQALLGFMEPGELFGELSVFDGGEREEFAEAMEKSSVISIPREQLQAVMDAHAHVSLGITKLMGLRRRRLERRLKSLLFRSNRERLVHLLLELVEKYGQRTPEGIQLSIKLSHQELANVIGSTRETVTVLLGELQDEGSLMIRRRQILITNMPRLAAAVDSPPPTIPEPTERKSAPAF